jgi:hypothetical protein
MVTSQERVAIEAKLMKKRALKDSPAIEVGETFIGYYFHKPKIGNSFLFFGLSNGDKLGRPFQTTKVTKIVDEFTFETKNSVYYLIDKYRERDIKIEDILK